MKNIIFDLDGTIIDPKEGITKSIQYALEKLGRPVLKTEELLWCIGPPLYESFESLLDSKDGDYVKYAVEVYREYYRAKGIYQFKLYPDIEDVFKGFQARECRLFIATSKPRIMAEEIVRYLKFEQYFKNIYGCELDGSRVNKSELLEYLLVQEKLAPSDAVMIGDRKHDIIGAKANGILTCGVAYGYGTMEELRLVGADYIVNKAVDLLETI